MQRSHSTFISAPMGATTEKPALTNSHFYSGNSTQPLDPKQNEFAPGAITASRIRTVPASMAMNNRPSLVILRLKQVQARVALGRSSIYALADKNSKFYDPSFPRSIKISVQAVGWIESEIDTWLMARIAASRCQ